MYAETFLNGEHYGHQHITQAQTIIFGNTSNIYHSGWYSIIPKMKVGEVSWIHLGPEFHNFQPSDQFPEDVLGQSIWQKIEIFTYED